MTNDSPTISDVAQWMKEQLDQRRELYQEDVVYKIKQRFGDDFVYTNQNGNLAIDKGVLKEFRKLTPNAVWERGERCWRERKGYDGEGRMAK